MGGHEYGLLGVIMAGVTFVALAYVLLNNSKNAASEMGSLTKAYANVGKTFQGG